MDAVLLSTENDSLWMPYLMRSTEDEVMDAVSLLLYLMNTENINLSKKGSLIFDKL